MMGTGGGLDQVELSFATGGKWWARSIHIKHLNRGRNYYLLLPEERQWRVGS